MYKEFQDSSPYIYKVIEKLCPVWDLFQYSEPGRKHTRPIIRFLRYESKEKPSKGALEAEAEFKKARSCYREGKCDRNKVTDAEKEYWREIRRDFRYWPDLRTLLLYLYNEYRTTVPGKKARIRKVLSNPQIILRAPFLEYWCDFRDCGLNLFNIFSITLMNIGMEYRSQLNIETGSEISLRLVKAITERVFNEVEIHFGYLYDVLGYASFIKENELENCKRLIETRNRYKRYLVSIQQGWLEDKRKELEIYEQECESFEQQSPR